MNLCWLQFRAEFFNLFNHPNFALPQGSFGTPSFGQITQTPDVAQGNPGLGGGGPRGPCSSGCDCSFSR